MRYFLYCGNVALTLSSCCSRNQGTVSIGGPSRGPGRKCSHGPGERRLELPSICATSCPSQVSERGEEDAAVCLVIVTHEWSLYFIIPAKETPPPSHPPISPRVFIWAVSRDILAAALEKVSSVASKCAALPASEPLSSLTFCCGGRPHCRSVNAVLCNRRLHIYIAE